jgi:hypothetical protein
MIPELGNRNGKNRRATDSKILIIEGNQILSSGYPDDGSMYLKDELVFLQHFYFEPYVAYHTKNNVLCSQINP